MICKFFYQPLCVKCPPAKRIVEELKKKGGVSIEEYDVSTAKGLAEATLNEVLNTPTIIIGGKIFINNFEQILELL